ncbi:hypothetical protein ACFUAC_21030 [Streptomyces sp. NPDC057148]|uniref:hypothetical protein n=1 Tax=unclassified Streptomyces TaxID=2593676 RepID=UPI00362F1719
MADEQDRWLDRETAEILLRGESLEAVDPAARDRAERLAEALGALTAPPVPTSEELPGEAAALAAFRKVRAERADEAAGAPSRRGRGASAPPADTGLIRIGPRGEGTRRPGRFRPLRLGLVAALTVGMVGGVAVAAGTGVLPQPFGDAGPDPAATVSAAASPDRPLTSPSPPAGVRGGPVPGGPTTGEPGRDERADGEEEDRDTDTGTDSGDRETGESGGGRQTLVAACRDARAGRELDDARRRALKEAAGSTSKIGKYCRNLLSGSGADARDRDTGRDAGDNGEAARERKPHKDAGGKGDNEGRGNKGGKGGKGGHGGEGGKGSTGGKGGGKGGGDKDGKGDDDDGGHIAPPAGHHGPHALPALPALPRLHGQGPTYLPHHRPAISDTLSDLRVS